MATDNCDLIRSVWSDLCDNFAISALNFPLTIDGEEMGLAEFCLVAHGQATEKLTPSQLLELQGLKEAQSSEERLRLYFFDEVGEGGWADLPEKARDRLQNADRIWFSGHGEEAVLEELTVAVLSLCHEAIWKPLSRLSNQPGYKEFADYQDQLRQQKGSSYNPGLHEYADVCTMNCFQTFLSTSSVTAEKESYLRQALPIHLGVLADFRRSAEHGTSITAREQVSRILKKFLGIGQQGVFLELAHLRRCVASQAVDRESKRASMMRESGVLEEFVIMGELQAGPRE